MGDADSCVGEGDGVQGEAGGGDAAVEDTAWRWLVIVGGGKKEMREWPD